MALNGPFHYLGRFFVIWVDDDADQEWRSTDSGLFICTDLLQQNSGSHTVRKAQNSTGSKGRESNRTKAFVLTGGQDIADALSQSLEKVNGQGLLRSLQVGKRYVCERQAVQITIHNLFCSRTYTKHTVSPELLFLVGYYPKEGG